MKAKKFGIFRRITILVFALITILGVLFAALTYYATRHYHLASTQLLNKDVAAHIAKFASPFDNSGINKRKADSVFKDVMVLNPSTEVYFLDTAGNIMDFYGQKKDIRLWKIPLQKIDEYILAEGRKYIKSADPKDPLTDKVFSAAEVKSNEKKLGFIYVILGSNEYKNVSEMLFNSHITNLALKAFVFIIILSVVLSLLYINSIRKSFTSMINVLEKFQNGDFNARFKTRDNDELAPVSRAFNKMADLLTYNINELTRSEKERKDFIANISHDLRTPLSIARGYAETLFIKKEAGNVTKDEGDNYIKMILNKILQVENMVKNLFELSKMESAEFKASKEPFVLSEIVQETVKTFQLNASEKKIDLKCTQCQYHVWINADISLMERVIQNLVDNAVKNTVENGAIKIGLEVENNNLILKIENTGNPLSAGLIEWINSAEINSVNPPKRPAKSGFGLAIVKKILSLHNSSLHAVTKNDNSNIFSFALPIYNPAPLSEIKA